jgi:hypothetical protein
MKNIIPTYKCFEKNIQNWPKMLHPLPAPGGVGSRFVWFRLYIMMYLTFSESFETIEVILQKILPDPKCWQLSGSEGKQISWAAKMFSPIGSIATKHFANVNLIAIL